MYKSFLKVLYVGLIVINLQSVIYIPAIVKDLLLVVYLLLLMRVYSWKIKVDRDFKFAWLFGILPYIIIWVYSIVTQIIRGYISGYLIHTTTLCVRTVMFVFLAVISARSFKDKLLDLLLIACILAYIPAWVVFFRTFGAGGIVILFQEDVFHQNIALEVHGLTYIFAFLGISYFYKWYIEQETATWKIWLCLFFMLCGVKRIVNVACVLAILVLVVFLKINKKYRYYTIGLASIGIIFVVFLYLYLIQTGMFEKILKELEINSSFRINFWNYFKEKYKLNPFFLGYGISYPHKAMAYEWGNIAGLGAETYIHNDVLGYYLGLGYIGTLLYWRMFFCVRTKFVREKYSILDSVFIFSLSMFYFIVMMVSNVGMDALYYGVYSSVSLAVISRSKAEKCG